MVAIFQVWSAGMVVAQSDVLEKTTHKKIKVNGRFKENHLRLSSIQYPLSSIQY